VLVKGEILVLAGRTQGSSSERVEPVGEVSTAQRRPWAAAMALTIASPRAAPPSVWERAGSARP
jgi:hypothetical protein